MKDQQQRLANIGSPLNITVRWDFEDIKESFQRRLGIPLTAPL